MPPPPKPALPMTRYDHKLGSWLDPFTVPKGPKVTCVQEASATVPSCKSEWDSTGCGAFGAKWGCPVVKCTNQTVKTCIGHKYQWQKMSCDLIVGVDAPEVADKLKKAVEDSMKEAGLRTLVVQIIAAIASAGGSTPSAGAQFTADFTATLTSKLQAMGNDAVQGKLGVKLRQACGWTDWQ
jgi:hypothetical protein